MHLKERDETPLQQYFSLVKSTRDSSNKPSHGPDSSRQDAPSHRRRRLRKNPKQLTLAEATEQQIEKIAGRGSNVDELEENLSLNKAIRQTLGKEDNPVTNSTAYSRTVHVQSCATGHQGGGGGQSWALHRNEKLRIQAADQITSSLKGVVGYISGYTGEGLNLELKACVERQGGRMVPMASGKCTHIFSTSNLSGSKAQKYFESNKKNKYKLVLPQWAFECERVGKRLSEASFVAPIKHERQESIFEIYKQTEPSTSATAPSLLALHTRSGTPQIAVSASLEEGSCKGHGTIILSPSPSPNSPRHSSKHKKRKSSTKSGRSIEKTKERTKSQTTKPCEEKKGKGTKKTEELLILGSSDVEIEDKDFKAQRQQERPRKDLALPPEACGLEEEELDEFGMPPSAQRR